MPFGEGSGSAQKASRRDTDEQFIVDRLIDRERGVVLEKGINRRHRIPALVPRSVWVASGRSFFDECVEDDAIASGRHQRSIRFQLGEHMIMRVIRVEADEYPLSVPGPGLNT